MTGRAVLIGVLLALPCTGFAQDADAVTKAVLDHRLTVELVKRAVAVDRGLLALMEKDPSIARRGSEKTAGIDATVKAMEAVPELAAALNANGISARDYILTQMALIPTTMMHELVASGRMPALPPGMPAHNVEFWKANYDVLKPLEAEWKKNREAITKFANRKR